MDIIFKTLDFSDKYTLPPSTRDTGYISMNGTIEHCGTGSFELAFHDEELEEYISLHPEGLFVMWGKFEGFFTDYKFTDKRKTVYGSHLNSLTHKFVFPIQNITEKQSIEVTVKELLNEYAPWLVFDDTGYTETTSFSTDSYMNGDKFLKEYLGKVKWGYRIYILGTELHFRLIKPEINPHMFSVGNKNIYEISEDFDSKDTAFGGWYKKTEKDDGTRLENETWIYISTEEKSGIYKRDTVLSSHSPQAAMDELRAKRDKHTFLAKTRNVEFNTDYTLGDVIRLRTKETTKKQVQSIEMWCEGDTYHEEPVFSEWEE